MRFDVITLFPDLMHAFLQDGVVGRAFEEGLATLICHNPRDFSDNKHRRVDDKPYGGGPGMVMQAKPLRLAIEHAKKAVQMPARVVYLSPQGKRLDQAMCASLAQAPRLILLAGRYEGIDQRIIDHDVDEEISIGDYVLSGGELPAMVLIDSVVRLLPGVLGNAQSASQDSFEQGLLDCPHYTRPEVLDGQRVPEVLLSGSHQAIEAWRQEQRLLQTKQKRPDLLN